MGEGIVMLVPRTCTEALDGGQRGPSRPLDDFRETPAYILLGEPGAGKTTAFRQEAAMTAGHFRSVRDFLALGPGPEWQGEPLFIDALDESYAGDNGRTALDNLRSRLSDLGRPAFRLSCREADWYAADQTDLALVSPDGRVVVLHLDDLDADKIRTILTENHGIRNAEGFIVQAKEHRLDDLLRNPQTLHMLAEALSDDRWPETRTQTYQMACEQLAIEPNPRHRHAWRGQAVSMPAVLDAAGHLCAIQLLAGLAGFAVDRDAADRGYAPLDELALPDAATVQRALDSRLFAAGERDEQRRPVHRSVAEYLAARWLGARIASEGLPLVRVLALITGEDGGVVSSLRGLHAWLAVHCLCARAELIDRDSLGVVLYGDARGFPAEDKRRLLGCLQAEAERYPWFRSGDWQTSPFGALATADMVEAFAEALASPARDREHPAFLRCVLDALTHGDPLPELAGPLMAAVRDRSYGASLNEHALAAYFHTTATTDVTAALRQLIDDIQAGLVEDKEDDLLGALLDRLYPSRIAASELIDYLHSPKNPNRTGNYQWFWSHALFERQRPQDYPDLMRGLLAAEERLGLRVDAFRLHGIIGEILIRAIETHGDRISPEQLIAWLGLAFEEDWSRSSWLDESKKKRIAAWLGGRADIYRGLIGYGLAQCQRQANFQQSMSLLRARLFDAELPADFDQWCLQQAEATESDQAARWLFDEVFFGLVKRHGWEGFPLETLILWVEGRPRFRSWLDDWLSMKVQQDLDRAQERLRHQAESKQHTAAWVGYVREHYRTIEDGSAYPRVLNNLAMIYWGHALPAQGDAPRRRLLACLGRDESLVAATITGLRRALEREDLSSVTEIIDLAAKGSEEFLIAQPCLAGADAAFAADPDEFAALDESILRRLIAFRLTCHLAQEPQWFDSVVRGRPDLIAEGVIATVSAMIRRGKDYIAILYDLARRPAYRAVVRLAVPALLDRFPLRVRKDFRKHLELLLEAGLRHLDESLLLNRIEAKLKLTSLDSGQRMLWLSAALLIDPIRYERQVAPLIQRSQAKARILAEFLRQVPREPAARKTLPSSTATLLIRVLAPTCAPGRWQPRFRVPANYEAADQVHTLIDQLGSRPDPEAQSALEALLGEQPLAAWHDRIRQALESQRLARREALFRYPPAQELVRALNNLEPAGPADLRALVLDQLETIAYELRHGNINRLRYFWNGDHPALENECRDALLDLLRPRLAPLNIDGQPEGYFAQEKRADIRISHGAYVLPIEIKKDSYRGKDDRPGLWRALREQLIARYTPDPGARGNGIYLVLWFGRNDMPMPPTGPPKPCSADELRQALLAQLTPQERRLVAVVVVDCSRPPLGPSRAGARVRKSSDRNA